MIRSGGIRPRCAWSCWGEEIANGLYLGYHPPANIRHTYIIVLPNILYYLITNTSAKSW
jgi:hypothetical protein